MEKTTIRFYPNKEKTNQITGLTPIYCRLIQGRKKKEVRLNKSFDLNQDEVGLWNEFTQSLNHPDSDLNGYINSIKTNFKQIIIQATTYGKVFTLSELTDQIFPSKSSIDKINKKDVTVISYAEKYLVEEVITPTKSKGTQKNYKNAINQLINYLKFNKLERLKMAEFEYEHANGYKLYLEKEIDPSYKKDYLSKKKPNKSISSATKIKNIKPVFNKAIAEKIITTSPFEHIKVSFKKNGEVKKLNWSELRRIILLNDTQIQGCELAKDIFLFMCYTGMSICDALKLNREYIRYLNYGEEKRIKLDTTRNKSQLNIMQIMIKPAQRIVEKYWRSDDYDVFPKISDADINRKLKTIAAAAQIPIILSTKVARSTCSNLLSNAGVKDDLDKKCFMGWSLNDNIRIHYENHTDERLLETTKNYELYIYDITYCPEKINVNIITELKQLKWEI
jgi:integrase